MIIKGLLDLIYNIFGLLTFPINIPDMPPQVETYISMALEYINMGLGILSNYTHLSYLLTLFSTVLLIDIGIRLYHVVMYIIKKIPMLNIK